MDISDIPKPVSIIHNRCGEEAFKYIGDAEVGSPICVENIIDYHTEHEPTPGGPIMCRSCDCQVEGVWDLYPQLKEVT